MNRFGFIIGVVFFGLILTSCRLISKTPKGINPNPVYDIMINTKLDILSLLKDSAISKQIDFKYFPYEKNAIMIKGMNAPEKAVFEQIEIFQYNSLDESEHQYQSYKQSSTQSSEDRLFCETGDSLNKYFIAFEVIHLDYNHGIPAGFINIPDIIICFKKDKYFLSVSYSSYSDKKLDYVAQINSDLICLSKVLKILNDNKIIYNR